MHHGTGRAVSTNLKNCQDANGQLIACFSVDLGCQDVVLAIEDVMWLFALPI
jgi:hypothetical protein